MATSILRMITRRLSTIASAHVPPTARMLNVTWHGTVNATRIGQFPVTWLRDNCRCPSCYDAVCQQRKLLPGQLDPCISPTTIKVSDCKENLDISWPDGHTSQFASDWLQSRDFGTQGHMFRSTNTLAPISPVLWRAEMLTDIRRFQFTDIMEDDRVLHDWLRLIEEAGIVLIVNAPQREGVLEALGERVGYIHHTYYGTVMRIESRDDPNNMAFTPGYLPLHTDLSYVDNIPDVQMFHCACQPNGMKAGENLFVDGFRAASDVRENHPNHFRLLSTVPIDFHDRGVEDGRTFYQQVRRTTFQVNTSDDVVGITVSPTSRDSTWGIPPETVQPMYEALDTLNKYLYHKRNILEYKLQPGDIMTMNNHRVLHGRNGYSLAPGSGRRLLFSAYLPWDAVRSCRRVISEQLQNDAEVELSSPQVLSEKLQKQGEVERSSRHVLSERPQTAKAR